LPCLTGQQRNFLATVLPLPHLTTQPNNVRAQFWAAEIDLVVLTIDTTEAEVESMAVDLDLVFADLQTFVQRAQNLI
jgi:hypothetical protein